MAEPVPHGIMFHHFHRAGERFGQGSITADEFADSLEFVGLKHILPAQEWFDRAMQGKLDNNDICLTFDDNLMCQYEVAVPVMQHYGLTAFFFIYSSVSEGNVENLEIYRRFRSEYFDSIPAFYAAFEREVDVCLPEFKLSEKIQGFKPEEYLKPFVFYTPEDRRFRYIRDELLGPQKYFQVMDSMIVSAGLTKEMLARNLWMDNSRLQDLSSKGNMIGLHSYSHPTRMCELSGDEQRTEYSKNYAHIVRATGKKPVAMSHPCNSYNADTLATLRSLGIQLGFCSNMGVVPSRGMLEFPRKDHSDVLRAMKS